MSHEFFLHIMSGSNGRIEIENSVIHGSLIQARDNSTIVLKNNRLGTNSSNPFFPGAGPCNPFRPCGIEVSTVTQSAGKIVVLGIDPIDQPVTAGNRLEVTEDFFVGSGSLGLNDVPYNLFYRRRSQRGQEGTILKEGRGPKRGQAVGALDTSDLASGRYALRLELVSTKGDRESIERRFHVVSSDPAPERPKGLTIK